jgi:hypothetical protein
MNAFEERETRTERIVVLLTPDEKAAIEEHADCAELSATAWIRLAAMQLISKGK